MDSEAREHQQRNRMAGHAFDDALRSLRVLNLAGNDRVEADDLVFVCGNVSPRGICLLGLQRMTYEKAVKLRVPAAELFDQVSTIQLLNVKRIHHGPLLGSNTEGSRNSRSRRA